jgi:hypothetical protein
MENDDNILKDCLGSSVNVGVWLVMTFAADRNGHIAECDDRLLLGVALENPKAAGGVHPLWVYWSPSTENGANFGRLTSTDP